MRNCTKNALGVRFRTVGLQTPHTAVLYCIGLGPRRPPVKNANASLAETHSHPVDFTEGFAHIPD